VRVATAPSTVNDVLVGAAAIDVEGAVADAVRIERADTAAAGLHRA